MIYYNIYIYFHLKSDNLDNILLAEKISIYLSIYLCVCVYNQENTKMHEKSDCNILLEC